MLNRDLIRNFGAMLVDYEHYGAIESEQYVPENIPVHLVPAEVADLREWKSTDAHYGPDFNRDATIGLT